MMALGGAPLDRLAATWGRRSSWRPTAVLSVVAIAIWLETATPRLDHGTHLLVALAAVLAIVLVLGPKPAVGALVLGAGVAGVASALGGEGMLHAAGASLQLAAYLFVGSMSILLVASSAIPRLKVGALDTSGAGHPTALPSAAAARLPEPLTARELEILRLAATGASVDDMSRRLCVSPNTTKTHLTHVYAKLGVRGRTDAVRAGLHAGILTPSDICPHHFAADEPEPPVSVAALRG